MENVIRDGWQRCGTNAAKRTRPLSPKPCTARGGGRGAEWEAVHVMGGVMSPGTGVGGPGIEQPGPTDGKPRSSGVTVGGGQSAPRQERARCLLSTDEGTVGDPEGDPRHRTQAR